MLDCTVENIFIIKPTGFIAWAQYKKPGSSAGNIKKNRNHTDQCSEENKGVLAPIGM
jgi:hypothetical protein